MDTYNLLIIDGDASIRGSLNELLAGRPEFGILIAADGREAARQLVANRIDIILTDLHMPGFTGIDLAADLQRHKLKPEILAMTTEATPADVETARLLGARGILLKPFDDLEVVEAEVEKALEAVMLVHRRTTGDGIASASKPSLWPAPRPFTAPADAPDPVPTSAKPTLWPAPKPAAAAAPPAAQPVAASRPVPVAPVQVPPAKETAPATPMAPPQPKPRAVAPAAKVHAAPHPVPAKAQTAPARETAAQEEIAPELPADIMGIFQTASSFDTRKMKMQVPIVCLQTWEEKEAIASLKKLAGTLHREFYVWSAARGLLKEGAQPMGETYGDASRTLEFVRRQKNNGLYVLVDFRPCLDDKKIVRVLREMVMELETARLMIVLIAPRLPAPPELTQACVVFDWPAGGSADLTALFDEVAAEVASSAGHEVRLDAAARETLLARVKDMPVGRARFEIASVLMTASRPRERAS